MSEKLLCIWTMTILLTTVCNSASAVTVYSVPGGVANGSNGKVLSWTGTDFPSRLAAKFTLSTSAETNKIVWWGASFSEPATPFHLVASFDIAIYSADSITEVIDASLLETKIPVSDIAAVPDGVNVFRYTATLPSAFIVQEDTPYWLSIAAHMPSNTTGWGWELTEMDGAPGNGAAGYFGAGWVYSMNADQDRAFELHWIPEPTLAAYLFASSISAYCWRRSIRQLRYISCVTTIAYAPKSIESSRRFQSRGLRPNSTCR